MVGGQRPVRGRRHQAKACQRVKASVRGQRHPPPETNAPIKPRGREREGGRERKGGRRG